MRVFFFAIMALGGATHGLASEAELRLPRAPEAAEHIHAQKPAVRIRIGRDQRVILDARALQPSKVGKRWAGHQTLHTVSTVLAEARRNRRLHTELPVLLELDLEQWDWLVDHAVRDLLHESVLHARGVLNQKKLATVWPSVETELEESMVAVAEAVNEYVGHFVTNAVMRDDEFLVRDRTWTRGPLHSHHEYQEREDRWSHRNFSLLCAMVIALNRYADLVRERWNPRYFLSQGRFLVIDSFGFRFGGEDTLLLPTPEFLEEHRRRFDPPDDELAP